MYANNKIAADTNKNKYALAFTTCVHIFLRTYTNMSQNITIKHMITMGTYENRIQEIQKSKLDLIYTFIKP